MRQPADVTASLDVERTALRPSRISVSSRAGRWSSWRWELPFWLGLFFWSLYPSLSTPWLDIGTIPISSKDLVTIGLATFYALCALAAAAHPARGGRLVPAVSGNPSQNRLPILSLGIVAYAALSTVWSDMEPRDSAAMLYTLLATVSAVALDYLMVANRPPEAVHAFMWRLTLF